MNFPNQQGTFTEPTGYVRKNGFTLLEVVAGMAIMMLLIGGVYGIANGALDLGIRSNEARKTAVREMNFSNVLRGVLEQLDGGVQVQVALDRITLSGKQGIFPIGNGTETADGVVFSTRENSIWVSHFRGQTPVSDLRLMSGVDEFLWECQDPVSGNWVRSWNVAGDLRPQLIRTRAVKNGAEETETFWIPSYRKGGQQLQQG